MAIVTVKAQKAQARKKVASALRNGQADCRVLVVYEPKGASIYYEAPEATDPQGEATPPKVTMGHGAH
jgi:hypothetical protein